MKLNLVRAARAVLAALLKRELCVRHKFCFGHLKGAKNHIYWVGPQLGHNHLPERDEVV